MKHKPQSTAEIEAKIREHYIGNAHAELPVSKDSGDDAEASEAPATDGNELF